MQCVGRFYPPHPHPPPPPALPLDPEDKKAFILTSVEKNIQANYCGLRVMLKTLVDGDAFLVMAIASPQSKTTRFFSVYLFIVQYYCDMTVCPITDRRVCRTL